MLKSDKVVIDEVQMLNLKKENDMLKEQNKTFMYMFLLNKLGKEKLKKSLILSGEIESQNFWLLFEKLKISENQMLKHINDLIDNNNYYIYCI